MAGEILSLRLPSRKKIPNTGQGSLKRKLKTTSYKLTGANGEMKTTLKKKLTQSKTLNSSISMTKTKKLINTLKLTSWSNQIATPTNHNKTKS